MTNLHEGTYVVSVGGAKLLDSLECLKSQLHLWDVFVVVFHSGTNNVNKTYYPEDSQISMASQSLVQIERSVTDLQSKYGFCFVFSGCVYTRSPLINRRIGTLNNGIKDLCRRI